MDYFVKGRNTTDALCRAPETGRINTPSKKLGNTLDIATMDVMGKQIRSNIMKTLTGSQQIQLLCSLLRSLSDILLPLKLKNLRG